MIKQQNWKCNDFFPKGNSNLSLPRIHMQTNNQNKMWEQKNVTSSDRSQIFCCWVRRIQMSLTSIDSKLNITKQVSYPFSERNFERKCGTKV